MLVPGKIEKKYIYSLLTTFIMGFVAHGIMITNKISFHDDICSLFALGTTWKSGRWGLGLIQLALEKTIGSYSLPLWIGLLSFGFIALSACMIISLFEIEDKLHCIILSAIMVVFPTVTVTFMYMFTAGCYFFALFLIVLAVWLIGKYKYGYLGSVVCIAFSVGIYQAYLAVGLVIVLLLIIKKCILDDARTVILTILKYVTTMGISMVVYLLIVKISLSCIGRNDLTSYQGLDSIMKFSIKNRIKRIRYCYLDIWKLASGDMGGLTDNWIISIVTTICIIVSGGLLVYLGFRIKKWINRIIYYGVALCIPIGINLLYPLSTEDTTVYLIMQFSLVFVWIIPLILLAIFPPPKTIWNKGEKAVKRIVEICVICSLLFYAHRDNVLYMKLSFLQEQTTSYYTVLISQIKNCDGYDDDYPVVYVGMGNIDDKTIAKNTKYDIDIAPANLDLVDWINDFAYAQYLGNHCGFAPEVLPIEKINKEEEKMIDQMPVYPDKGSIQVVHDKIIVKFAERQQDILTE